MTSYPANQTLTEAQENQVRMAAQFGVSHTACREHPEWGPNLMNLVWNRERAGKDLTPAYLAAGWLRKNLGLREDGCLYDDIEVLSYVFRAFERGGRPMCPVFDDRGAFDRTEYLFRITRDKALVNSAAILPSGRVSLPDYMEFLDDVRLMGEGLKEAEDILVRLKKWAADEPEAQTGNGEQDMQNAFNRRQWRMTSILLTLDDMNLRGYQLPYALRYAGGSTEVLFRTLWDGRSRELCDYVNDRSIDDFRAGDSTHNQIAVSHGASFQREPSIGWERIRLTMDERHIPPMRNTPALTPDWGSLDIKNDITAWEAMRICRASGFELVREIPYMESGERSRQQIWYHPETKDYLVFGAIQEKDACYGGVRLLMHRTPQWYLDDTDCSSGPHKGQPGRYFEFTQHDGCFRCWHKMRYFLPKEDYDWNKIGFSHYGIPIPDYIRTPHVTDREDAMSPSLRYLMENLGGLHFSHLANALIALSDKELSASPSPHYALLTDWVMKNALQGPGGWYTGQDEGACKVASLVFTYLRVPDGMIREMVEHTAKYFAELDERKRAMGGRPEHGKAFRDLAKSLTNRDPDIGQIMKACRLPDVDKLPVLPDWIKE